MRAAVIAEMKGSPVVQDFPDPKPQAGAQIIEVIAGGIGPTDLMRANGTYSKVSPPYVIAGEGVGRLADGKRVYFGHSVAPYGGWGQKTLVPDEEIWPIPDDLDDGLAIAIGLSGTGALIPLEEAQIQKGERVLILGATGPLGQIALQLAREMGAGTVVAAARTAASLERVKSLGLADEIVQLGQGDDLAALKAAAGDGYDVVLDVVFGPPAEAAIKATAFGARIKSIGIQAGFTVTLSLADLIFRNHAGVGTGQRSAAERRAAYERLVALARAGKIKVDVSAFALADAAKAWETQRASAHGKVILRPNA